MAPPTTFFVTQEGTGSSKSLHLDVNRDNDQVVVASSAIFRIYDIEDGRFRERVNLRGSKTQNLNYSCNDVCWNKHDPHILATAATNGAVVLWNLARTSRAKQEHVFNEHQRTVRRFMSCPFTLYRYILHMPCPFTGLKLFCASPNFLSQPKNLTAFSASSKPFVSPQKSILLDANHLFVWHKMFVTAKMCK